MNSVKQWHQPRVGRPFFFGVVIALTLWTMGFGAVAISDSVIPDFYIEPGHSPFRELVSDNATEHVDPLSGNLFLSYVDLIVPGNGGLDIKIQRSYNSSGIFGPGTTLGPIPKVLSRRTPTGLGWTMHFGRLLKTSNLSTDGGIFGPCSGDFTNNHDTLNNAVLELPDGSRQVFYTNATPFDPPTLNSNALLITKEQWVGYCIPNTSGAAGIIAISPDGTKYTMNHHRVGPGDQSFISHHAWYTTKIEDRNGNSISIAYDTAAENSAITGMEAVFSRITSSDGRIVTFTYTNRTTPNKIRLTSVTSNGQRWQYKYSPISFNSPHYRLTRVITPGPNALQWNYSYHTVANQANFRLLKQITYPYGGTSSYKYKYQCMVAATCNQQVFQSILVASKTSGGPNITGGTWTYTYTPSTTEDVTTVTLPGGKGKIRYHHFGTRQFTNSSASCAQTPPELWKMGLLQKKEVFNDSTTTPSHQEIFTWEPLNKISEEDFIRPPFDGSTLTRHADCSVWAPVLTKKQIIRDGTTYTTTFSNFQTADASFSPRTIVESGQANRTITRTYFPRNADQNIVGMVDNETVRLGGVCLPSTDPACQFNGRTLRTFDTKGNVRQINRRGVTEEYSYFNTGDLFSKTLRHRMEPTPLLGFTVLTDAGFRNRRLTRKAWLSIGRSTVLERLLRKRMAGALQRPINTTA